MLSVPLSYWHDLAETRACCMHMNLTVHWCVCVCVCVCLCIYGVSFRVHARRGYKMPLEVSNVVCPKQVLNPQCVCSHHFHGQLCVHACVFIRALCGRLATSSVNYWVQAVHTCGCFVLRSCTFFLCCICYCNCHVVLKWAHRDT